MYLDPRLARETLEVVMMVTDAQTGAKTYSYTGHGVNEDALGLHRYPSDLDLFFLLGLSEYLAATGDRAFLYQEVDFHPRDASTLPPGAQGKTVLDHVRVALRHLTDAVGRGEHGLIRTWDGDWSDGIVYEDLSPLAIQNTIARGESVPNSQMALYVLPLAAAVLEPEDPALAQTMRDYAESLRGPVLQSFGTRWFGRAWLYDSLDRAYLKGNDLDQDPDFGSNFIDLEAQPWGLLAEVLDPAARERVLDEVEARLDADSPIGPRLRPGGQVWPAISQLMTWCFALWRPASAWRSLEEHTWAAHAQAFPEVWLGIWSGPDGFVSTNGGGADEGGTWVSPVTPMTDFPVSNMNPEAMALLGLLRTAGIEPGGDGLSVTPRGGGVDRYTIDFPLLRLEAAPERIGGLYRAHNDGSVVLRVAVPAGAELQAFVRGKPVDATPQAGRVALRLDFTDGEEVPFEILVARMLPALAAAALAALATTLALAGPALASWRRR